MKQNLMQIQLKNSYHKRISQEIHSIRKSTDNTTLDLTTKAYYIFKQLKLTSYMFNKKSLASYLNGKNINLLQKGNERPITSLKGYMNLQSVQQIEQMIDVMIQKQVLFQEKVLIKDRHNKRLIQTKKYDENKFPKIIINVSSTSNIRSITKSMQKKKQQPVQGHEKQFNLKNTKQSSRLTSFLFQKANLSVNVQKREHEIKQKIEKQKQDEFLKRKEVEDELKRQREQQKNEQQQRLKKQKLAAQAKLQKQKEQKYMHNFWIKERQKLIEFVCPRTDISLIQSPSIKEKDLNQRNSQGQTVVQTAGNILHMQMKELKQNENKRNNPIKPLFSWSFIKDTLGIEGSQSQKQRLKALQKIKQTKNRLFKDKIELLFNEKNDEKTQQYKEIKTQFRQVNRQKQQKLTPKTDRKPSNIKVDKNLSQKVTPNLLSRSYPKMLLQGNQTYKSYKKQQRQFEYEAQNSLQTSVTTTNFQLRNGCKQKPDYHYNKGKQIEQNKKVFVQSYQKSVFKTPYSIFNRRSTQTIGNNSRQKINKEKNQRNSNKQRDTSNKKNSIEKNVNIFSFKRTAPSISEKDPAQQTMTMIKKPCLNTDFQQLSYVLNKDKQQQDQDILIDGPIRNYEIQRTNTIAVPRYQNKKYKGRSPSFKRNISIYQDSRQKIDIDMFSQTLTTPQPRTKNKKICTEEVEIQTRSYGQERKQRKQRNQTQIKRDSFVEELIQSVYYKRR